MALQDARRRCSTSKYIPDIYSGVFFFVWCGVRKRCSRIEPYMQRASVKVVSRNVLVRSKAAFAAIIVDSYLG